jgi:hypothetical protein
VAPHVTNGTPNIEVFEIGGGGVAFSSFGSDPDLIAQRGLAQFGDAIMNGGEVLVHMGAEDVEIDATLAGNGNFAQPAEENGMLAVFGNVTTSAFDLHRRVETGLSAAIINNGAVGEQSQNVVMRWPHLLYLRQNGANVELKSHRLDTNANTSTLALSAATLASGGRASVEPDAGVQGITRAGRFALFWTTTSGNVLKAQPLANNGAWAAGTVVTVDATANLQNGNFVSPPNVYGALMVSPTPAGAGLIVEALTWSSSSPFAPTDKTTVFQPTGQGGRAGWIVADRLYMAHEGRALQIFEVR